MKERLIIQDEDVHGNHGERANFLLMLIFQELPDSARKNTFLGCNTDQITC